MAYVEQMFVLLTCSVVFGTTIENDLGLIISSRENKHTKDIYILPLTPDKSYGQEYIRSYRFPDKALFTSLAGDYTLQHLYVYDFNTQTIYSDANFSIDGYVNDVMMIFHRGISRNYVNLAVDPISHNIYWTDTSFKWIMVKSLLYNDMSMYRVLIHENLDGPVALALDPMERLLFWSDIGMSTRIEVSSLSGRNRKTLISSKLVHPSSLAADYAARRIYLYDSEESSLETFTYEGKYRTILLRKSYVFGIAVYKDYLYMTNNDNGGQYVVNKTNGNELYTRLGRDESYLLGLALFRPDPMLNPDMDYCMDNKCEHMCVAEKDSATCLCKDGYSLNQDKKTCSLQTEYLHRVLMFTNDTSICIADIRVMADFAFVPKCIQSFNGTKHMILDTDQRKMFLATNMNIFWAYVDNPEIHILTKANGTISGLAWDRYNRSLYWTEKNTGTIWRHTIESDIPHVVVSGLKKPHGIIFIPSERQLYWISNESTIESCNRNGSNQHILLDSNDLLDPKSLSYDEYTKRIYFRYMYRGEGSIIQSCKFDGSDPGYEVYHKEIIDILLIYKGYVLVTDNDFNGTVITSYSTDTWEQMTSGVFPNTGQISTIQIFDETIHQSETSEFNIGPCNILNGQCEDICVPHENTRVCDCRFGFRLTVNGMNCTSDPIKDNFMLVVDSSDNTVYQISLIDECLEGIGVKSTDSLSGVTYSPVDNVIIFGATSKVVITHLNGTIKQEFPGLHSDDVIYTPNRFAVDYSTGNIYYTVTNNKRFEGKDQSYISILSPSGKQRTLVKGLIDPTGLAVYPSKGLLFYSEGSFRPRLGQATMDGGQSSIVLDLNGEAPTDLTIDYSSDNLYYIASNTKGVKYCKLDGTNHRTLIQYYATGIGAAFLYKDHMFISTNKNKDIIKLDISMPRVMTTFADTKERGIINFISIYSSTDQNQNDFCSAGNGGCSTFCFPSSSGGICGCEDGIELEEGSDKVCSNIHTAEEYTPGNEVNVAVTATR